MARRTANNDPKRYAYINPENEPLLGFTFTFGWIDGTTQTVELVSYNFGSFNDGCAVEWLFFVTYIKCRSLIQALKHSTTFKIFLKFKTDKYTLILSNTFVFQ